MFMFEESALQAGEILKETYNKVNTLFSEIKADEAGYMAISQMLDQIQADIGDALERVRRGTVRIGILGGRGSGKSTLANALMGSSLLPESAIIFCTIIPTSMRYDSQYSLVVKSELEEFSYSGIGVPEHEIRKVLRTICKESENPQNAKRVLSITLGVPHDMLNGKEIVDLPGFTKGNPLHQAFAEQYARHYCDVCLVLVNNFESVEIDARGGLQALAYVFKDRLDTTVFIINKCDGSSDADIGYIEKDLQLLLQGADPKILRISARNSLKRRGQQFNYQDLLGYLSTLSSQKTLIIAKAFLERLISNLTSLKELCQLSATELNTLYQNIDALLNIELEAYIRNLWGDREKNEILPSCFPTIDLSCFKLPSPFVKAGPYEYAKDLAESISEQAVGVLEEFVQQHQANIYRALNERFQEQVGKCNHALKDKVCQFEIKFGVTIPIEIPKVENVFEVEHFDPSAIEALRPLRIRLWFEKFLPGALVRDVKFWRSPIAIHVGPLTIPLGIPIGVKSRGESMLEIQENVPEHAVCFMNEYVLNSLDVFAKELYRQYSFASEKFEADWRNCLGEYLERIGVARDITEPDSVNKIELFINDLRNSLQQLNLMIRA